MLTSPCETMLCFPEEHGRLIWRWRSGRGHPSCDIAWTPAGPSYRLRAIRRSPARSVEKLMTSESTSLPLAEQGRTPAPQRGHRIERRLDSTPGHFCTQWLPIIRTKPMLRCGFVVQWVKPDTRTLDQSQSFIYCSLQSYEKAVAQVLTGQW